MRLHLPPQLAFALATFVVLLGIALFGFIYLGSSDVQAQDEPSTAALVTATPIPEFPNITIGISHSSPAYVGEPVILTASFSITDITGLNITWDFGDNETGSGRVVEHVYTRTGKFRVRLFVTDGQDILSSFADIQVGIEPTPTVGPPGPVTITIPTEPPYEAQQVINFLATVEQGMATEFDWNFGDGTTLTSGPSVSHEYSQPGRYAVSAVARNSAGESPRRSISIVIEDAPPQGLSLSYTPNPARIGDVVTLRADVERGTNLTYEWWFSDGEAKDGQIILRTFDSVDDTEVRLVAYNSKGRAELIQTILVGSTPPMIVRIIEGSPVNVGEVASVLVFVKSRTNLTIYWEWGDGKHDVTEVEATSSEERTYQSEMSHAYRNPGKYPLCITAVNSSGHDRLCTVIYVQVTRNPQTLDSISMPISPMPGRTYPFPITEDGANAWDCKWNFIDPRDNPSDKTIDREGHNVDYSFPRGGNYILSVECRTTAGELVRSGDFVITVDYPSYLPIITDRNSIIPVTFTPVRNPPTPTDTMTPTPTMTLAAAATATTLATPTPTMTPLPTATATPTPTLIPTMPTTTPTNPPNGTIPRG